MKRNKFLTIIIRILLISLVSFIVFIVVKKTIEFRKTDVSVDSIAADSKENHKIISRYKSNTIFLPKTKSYIYIDIKTDDTLSLVAKSFPRFPLFSNNKAITIYSDTTIIISLVNNSPSLVNLVMDNITHNIFIYPNDTTSISVIKKEKEIRCFAENKTINSFIVNYYLQKDSVLGHTDRRTVLPAINSSIQSYENYCSKVDSLYDAETFFLDSCLNHYKYPNWFVDFERNEILYFNASTKLSTAYYHNKYLSDSSKYEDYNLDYLDTISLNNENAFNSLTYYEYLSNYNIHIGYQELINLKGTHHALKVLEIFNDSLSNSLSTEISNKYYIYLTSQVVTTFSGVYIRYNLDTNKIYSIYDSIIASINKRSINNEYSIYVSKSYNEFTEFVREIKILSKGEKAPQFYLSDQHGKFHDIVDYRGKTVLINFWIEFCNPCLNSVPYKNKILEKYADKDFELLNIFISNNTEKWKSLIDKNNIKGTNLICYDNWATTLKQNYNISAYPKYVLIDENGLVLENRYPRLTEIDSLLNTMLN